MATAKKKPAAKGSAGSTKKKSTVKGPAADHQDYKTIGAHSKDAGAIQCAKNE